MKFIEKSNGLYITGIEIEDLAWRNLGGRVDSDDPGARPSHYIDLKVRDTNLLEYLLEQGVTVKDAPDYKNPDVINHVVRFKAYPKVKENPITHKTEHVPKVMIRVESTDTTRRLSIEEFREADRIKASNISIRFHIYRSEYHGVHIIPSIDEYWCSVDEFTNDHEDYLSDLYGSNQDPNEGVDDVPFV